jgi:diaminopimelate decarboxylase
MDHAAALIAKYFNLSSDELVIGGVPVSDILARYGTPLFVYDSSVIDRKLDLLREALPARFAIFYSVKANPNPAILRHFLGKGCGLEIASSGELHIALSVGCAPERILFAGPGKTEAELELALSHDIGEIHVESLLEAERIGNICRRLGKKARVALRVNPSGEAQGGAMRMGGKPAPFGIDEETLDEVLDRVLGEPSINVQGIHLFTGTQILDYNILLGQYRKGLEIGRMVVDRVKRPLHTIDFGGGLGIPYFARDEELNVEKLRIGLAQLFDEIENDSDFKGTNFVVEPGRYLVGEAGIYIARVNDIKVSRGKTFLILDGGMNHHLAASGNLGQVFKRNFPITLLNKLQANCHTPVDIVGPLCTPLDTLARDVELPIADVGDFVGIFKSGAYALTASPLGFLSHPGPAEVLVENGQTRLIRRRGSYCDLLAYPPCYHPGTQRDG